MSLTKSGTPRCTTRGLLTVALGGIWSCPSFQCELTGAIRGRHVPKEPIARDIVLDVRLQSQSRVRFNRDALPINGIALNTFHVKGHTGFNVESDLEQVLWTSSHTTSQSCLGGMITSRRSFLILSRPVEIRGSRASRGAAFSSFLKSRTASSALSATCFLNAVNGTSATKE